jgi:tetratricopeptide (TPR) repeat protein/cellulose biosynthesis protein BcsQ
MKPARSRILTFYSYKGGTGRTMTLANVGWVLASNGYRVLAIDWDLEAPGLHRYFHPFLIDSELTASPGVIDLLSDFVAAAVAPAEGEDERWYEAHADVREYAVAIDWKFPSPGRLDLVPAGRQGPGYAARVNAFDWQHFYDEIGGGAFLEEVKARMSEHYDYVLIDSRTGVSDTAGICTVQMPDTLVVCFTANRQSVEGTAAVARSVQEAWGELPEAPRRIFPVLTRVELGEKERLGRAQEYARAAFAPFLDHLAAESRAVYWDRVEMLYYPFYAYEEVLAVFGDRPGQSRSVLASAEQLTGYLTDGTVTGLIAPTEEERANVLARMLRGEPAPVQERPERPVPERTYRAFVCSTTLDLHAQRAVAINALREAAFQVVSMEDHAPSESDAPVQRGLDRVRQCDLLVLLVAFRRGYVPPEQTLSFSQMQYEAARESGIDILVFLVDEAAPWPQRFVETANDPEVGRWRAELEQRHVVRRFATNDALQLEVSRAALGWLVQRQVRDRLPSQVPAPPGHFIGRAEELEALVRQLSDPTVPTLVALTGMSGVGKTALASLLAERLASRFPDGRLFLAGRGATRCDILAHIVRSFRPGDRLEGDEPALEIQVRSVLAGKRALLVLDDVEPEQLNNLTLPGSCALLATSRQRPGLRTHHLGPLPQAEAVALLRGLVPRLAEEEAGAIASACGGLPLALHLAGAFLAERADLDAARYLERLREERLGERTGLGEVKTALRHNEELLPEPLRSAWRMLAVFATGFTENWASVIWEVERDRAEDDLAALRNVSLLDWDAQAKCYQLHELVREYASAAMDEETRKEAERRHARWCLAEMEAAGVQDSRGEEALPRFDRIWPEIQAAFARTCAAGEDRIWPEIQEALRLCIDLTERVSHLRLLRQHPSEGVEWAQAALRAARALGDRLSEANALGNLGVAHKALGQAQKAIDFFDQRLDIARQIKDRAGESKALGNLGVAYAALSQTQKAIEFYQQRLEIVRELNDRRAEAKTLGNLGIAHADLGLAQKAIEFCQHSLEIERAIRNRRGEAYGLVNLGRAYAALGQPRRAIDFFEQSLAIARELGDRRSEAAALGKLGKSYADLGQWRRTFELNEQRLAICREVGDRKGEAGALGNIGLALAALGGLPEALDLHMRDLAITRAVKDLRGESMALGHLGSTYRQLRQAQPAIEFLEQALGIARAIGDRKIEGQTLGALGLASADLGRSQRSQECFQRQLAITRQIGDRQGEASASWNLGLALQADDQIEEALPLLEACVNYQRAIGHPDTEKNASHVAGLRQTLARSRVDPAAEILSAIATRSVLAATLLPRYRSPEYRPLWRQHADLYRRFGKRLVEQGNPGLALELVREGLEDHPGDAELLYLEALALSRSGSIERTQEKIDALLRRDDLTPRLRVDAHNLMARMFKDRYRGDWHPSRRRALANQAARHYQRAFELEQGCFPAVSAATMALLAGDTARSQALAQRGVELGLEQQRLAQGGSDHWLQATLGEACLLLSDASGAAGHYRSAAELAGADHGSLAAMRRQLQLLQATFPVEVESLLAWFPARTVVVFAGHRLDSPRRSAAGFVRFPPVTALESAVRQAIRDEIDRLDPIAGYCVPRSGADLLFAELILEGGRELHVVLPFDRDDFFRTQVDYGQPEMQGWRTRCEAVLERAQIHCATQEEFLGDLVLFEFADRFLQGLALVRNRQVNGEVHALLVLDGSEGQDSRTLRFGEEWVWEVGPRPRVIDLAALRAQAGVVLPAVSRAPPAGPSLGGDRQVRAMLFADVKWAGKLPDLHPTEFYLAFLNQAKGILGQIGGNGTQHEESVDALFYNTWGDGLFVVTRDVRSASDLALQLLAELETVNWSQLGLPPDTTVRVGLHTGPVFWGIDPVLARDNFFGSDVNRAASIEPVALPGCAFASEQFAACLSVEAADEFACEYLGLHYLAREDEVFPLYRVMRR